MNTTIIIGNRRYVASGEPANVFGNKFRELHRVTAEDGTVGMLFQHADQRLAFAAALDSGLSSTFLRLENHHEPA